MNSVNEYKDSLTTKEDDGSRSGLFTAMMLLNQHYANNNALEGIESQEERARRVANDVRQRLANGETPQGMALLSAGYVDSLERSEARRHARREQREKKDNE